MILFVCDSLECKTVTRVMGRSVDEVQALVGEGSEWWPKGYKCPQCEGPASALYEIQINPNQFKDFHVRELDSEDYFRFLMGVGLPEETDCSIEALQKIFHDGTVKKIAGHRIPGAKRFCVEWVEMADGTRLYFGASSHGATIYRIVKKPNYTEQALNDS